MVRDMPTTTRFLSVVPLALLLLLGGACSGGDEEAADDIATLGDDESGDDESDDSDSEDDDSEDDGGGQGGRPIDPEFQDAMVEFAECMREHGIDMPDPQVGEGGMVVIGGGPGAEGDGPPSEAEQEEMEAANEACQPILEDVRGSMPELDPEQEAEMQEEALAFAECMREHGIDMPDPVFSDGGRVTMEIGDEDGPGFDPTDDDFQEAAEDCGGEGGFIGVGSAGLDDGDDD
jgi:hypothetical protein